MEGEANRVGDLNCYENIVWSVRNREGKTGE